MPRPVHGRHVHLADHAEAVAETGKLYINGAGVGTVWMRQAPGQLPPLVHRRTPAHPVAQNNQAVHAPHPGAQRRSDTRRPRSDPGSAARGRPRLAVLGAGDEMAINAVVGIGGLPVKEYGKIYFHLEVKAR